MFWGLTPALDFQSKYKQHNLKEINIILIGSSDCRHILKTLARRYRYPNVHINFYVLESCMENIARQLLFLLIAFMPQKELGEVQKTRIFMELYGNTIVRPYVARFLTSAAKELLTMTTDLAYSRQIMPFVDLDVKYKEKDYLANIFKFWSSPDEFDISEIWNKRLRKMLATEKSFEGIRDVQQSIAITNNGHETQSSDFERNVLRELSWINTKLNMIIDNLNSYNRLEKISNDDEPPTEVLSNLPVNNEEALFQLENYLNGSEANIILMAKELSKIGGTKVKDLLRRIMYRVISNEMGMLYSWDGAKGKKPLKQLALSRVIIRAVRFNRPTASASETEIVDLVRLWLVRCKDRANKQKKDNQEKTEN